MMKEFLKRAWGYLKIKGASILLFLKRMWRYVKIDGVSTIFLLIMLIATVVSLSQQYTVEGGLLAMCDLFIFRGIIWQGGYYDLIQKLRNEIAEKQAEIDKLVIKKK